MNTETKTIELGGQLYEIKLVEPQPETKPTLPTLQEVFNKVQPKFCLSSFNHIMKKEGFEENDSEYHSQLSTERQCKRIQALIALQNIADYYNDEVDYRGRGFALCNHIGADMVSIFEVVLDFSTPIFRKRSDAESAIEILRNAQLLQNL